MSDPIIIVNSTQSLNALILLLGKQRSDTSKSVDNPLLTLSNSSVSTLKFFQNFEPIPSFF